LYVLTVEKGKKKDGRGRKKANGKKGKGMKSKGQGVGGPALEKVLQEP